MLLVDFKQYIIKHCHLSVYTILNEPFENTGVFYPPVKISQEQYIQFI